MMSNAVMTDPAQQVDAPSAVSGRDIVYAEYEYGWDLAERLANELPDESDRSSQTLRSRYIRHTLNAAAFQYTPEDFDEGTAAITGAFRAITGDLSASPEEVALFWAKTCGCRTPFPAFLRGVFDRLCDE